MDKKADIGLIGLAVMGQNLVLNMNDKGFGVAVFNRTHETTRSFLAGPASGRPTIFGAKTIEEFVSMLERPRKIMLMVRAGGVVDTFIETLLLLVDPGDLIIDGGNSNYQDTNRRAAYLASKGILFVGTGVSGGEEGARHGPSIMPGGNAHAWPIIKGIFQSICAKTEKGEPCCDWVGEAGSGHFVKMVHNGIEYGDMQLISEAYALMKSGLQMSADEMAFVFANWNKGRLSGYLIEITAQIFAFKDTDGTPLVDKILDAAGQKGTGKWTGINALELGVPVSLIVEAVFARSLSALKNERLEAARALSGPAPEITAEKKDFLADIEKALLASKIISYAQGFMLMREASRAFAWDLNFGNVALMWRGGCIIRSVFLEDIKQAFLKKPDLSSLLLDGYFKDIIDDCQASWRRVVAAAVSAGIALPAMSTALSFYDGYRCQDSPANLLQAQRDFFGAHTYERVDRAPGEFFHTNWTGSGGETASGTYTV